MYHCPICGIENTVFPCACGFDISRDYEGYPTLAPLDRKIPSRAALGKNVKDLHRCAGCGGMLFYLNPGKGVSICAKCGKEEAIAVPKPKPKSVPVSPLKTTPKKINTYQAYMTALEQLFQDNGKKMLSENQIERFLRDHQLDKRFNIRLEDVRKDLQAIYAGYKPQNASTQISTYKSYMQALEALYMQNGRQMLSSQQIQDFLLTHNLGTKFGITAGDVQKDLNSITKKH